MKLYCRTCKLESTFRRINRQGIIQQAISRLGFYPWECVNCRTTKFLQNSGRRAQAPDGRGYIPPS